jgi:hypothetical protein
MQKRIQIVTNANTQGINEIVLMIFINTTSPRQSNGKHRNQVKKVNGKEISHGQADCLQNWPTFSEM